MKKLLISAIKLYQKTISPDHGWFSGGRQSVCKFHPTCSNYTIEAIEKYGSLKGSLMGAWRILRCNPFSKGGNDPVK
jgi:putative membrane protein insertion efficiency factor